MALESADFFPFIIPRAVFFTCRLTLGHLLQCLCFCMADADVALMTLNIGNPLPELG